MLGRLKARTRIYAGFATVIIIGLAVAGFGVWQVSNVGTQVRAMDAISGNVARVLKATSGLEAIRRAELRYRLNVDEASRTAWQEGQKQVESLLRDSIAVTRSDDRRRIYTSRPNV